MVVSHHKGGLVLGCAQGTGGESDAEGSPVRAQQGDWQLLWEKAQGVCSEPSVMLAARAATLAR
jgi:hypothetical protein